MADQRNTGEKGTRDIFVARHPILKRNSKLYGYELLFRSSLKNYFDPTKDGSQATSNVITNTFSLFGINSVTVGKKAFINFNTEMLLGEYPSLFPKNVTVVEVLESVEVTPEIVQACANLVKKGYLLALDDFEYSEAWIPLLEMAHIIKFDIRMSGLAKVEEDLAKVEKYNVKLLAEKVETLAEYDATFAMGFDLFQGYYFCRPQIIEGKDIPGSKLQYLHILRLLQDADYSFEQMAQLISRDVSLSYKLLKYVNSAGFGARVEVTSLQSAIALVGDVDMRKWLSLTMISYLADDKPEELLCLSIQRAVFCEEVGRKLGKGVEFTKQCFLAGMFSLLDVLLGKPMDYLLEELSLADSIKKCLLEKPTSPLGIVLFLAKSYERADWAYILKATKVLDFPAEELPVCFAAAVASVAGFSATD